MTGRAYYCGFETRLLAVRDHLEKGLTVAEVLRKYQTGSPFPAGRLVENLPGERAQGSSSGQA